MSPIQTYYLPETTIRYTVGNLGCMDDPYVVAEGDLGRYLGPAQDDGWHLTEPAKAPGRICPVSLGMIEDADAPRENGGDTK